MKRNNIILACVLLAAFLLGLTGLSFAKEGGNADAANDRLIGMFITTEHLDLFDFESYANDNAATIFNGGEISLEKSAGYQGRIYASVVDKTLTDSETGETFLTKECVFEGVEGIAFFYARLNDAEREYGRMQHDEALSLGKMDLAYTDEGESVKLSGTLNVSYGSEEFYMNPVYQQEDGGVYLMSGQGMMVQGMLDSEGAAMSQTMSGTQTYSENGVSQSFSSEITISIEVMHEPQSVTILQFGKNGALLSNEIYAPEETPEKLVTEAGTEYIVVETLKLSPSGEEVTTRRMFQHEDDLLESFYARPDGLCVARSTLVEWR